MEKNWLKNARYEEKNEEHLCRYAYLRDCMKVFLCRICPAEEDGRGESASGSGFKFSDVKRLCVDMSSGDENVSGGEKASDGENASGGDLSWGGDEDDGSLTGKGPDPAPSGLLSSDPLFSDNLWRPVVSSVSLNENFNYKR